MVISMPRQNPFHGIVRGRPTTRRLVTWVMPAIFWWEYKLGYHALHGSEPRRIRIGHLTVWDYLHSDVFARLIWPTLVGSMFLAIPSAIATYLFMRMLVSRAQTRASSPQNTASEFVA